jgi:hypothetical protein
MRICPTINPVAVNPLDSKRLDPSVQRFADRVVKFRPTDWTFAIRGDLVVEIHVLRFFDL